jgi:hypothetical protein
MERRLAGLARFRSYSSARAAGRQAAHSDPVAYGNDTVLFVRGACVQGLRSLASSPGTAFGWGRFPLVRSQLGASLTGHAMTLEEMTLYRTRRGPQTCRYLASASIHTA